MNVWVVPLRDLLGAESPWAWPVLLGASLGLSFLIKIWVGSKIGKPATKSSSIEASSIEPWKEGLWILLSRTRLVILFVWLSFFFTRHLQESLRIHQWVGTVTLPLTVLQLGIWGMVLIRLWNERVLQRRAEADPSSAAALGLLNKAVQGAFLATLVLMCLSNLGVNIGALIAGLGVGGIAVALAAQNILGDLLASLSIVLDKPFSVGDLISAGNDKGTVESIGIKTTRIRSASGEQIILSNKDLLESRVRNFKRLVQRRVEHRFVVDPAAAPEKVGMIPAWVREVFSAEPQARLEHCHLSKLGDAGLEIEFAFVVLDPDQQLYLDIQHRVLLGIWRRLAVEQVSLAPSLRAAGLASGWALFPGRSQGSES